MALSTVCKIYVGTMYMEKLDQTILVVNTKEWLSNELIHNLPLVIVLRKKSIYISNMKFVLIFFEVWSLKEGYGLIQSVFLKLLYNSKI